jgi:hypothetical protein
MSSYHYSRLPEHGNIRLFRLLPHADETAPIKGQLFNFSLSNPVKGTYLYDAVSYVWGDPHRLETIEIDQCILKITVSLHTALVHLRDPHFERVIWVDAVCINQDNLEERGNQIKSMPQIYGKAQRVIVWLGNTAESSDEAIEELREAADEEMKVMARNENAILKLLQRPWFRRTWVWKSLSRFSC